MRFNGQQQAMRACNELNQAFLDKRICAVASLYFSDVYGMWVVEVDHV